MVADGHVGVAVLPISEILTAKGVDYAGSLAPEIQFPQVFSAAIVAGSREVDNASRLIAFLSSSQATEAIIKREWSRWRARDRSVRLLLALDDEPLFGASLQIVELLAETRQVN